MACENQSETTTRQCHTKSVSQEATKAQSGNRGSPPARSIEITESRATFSQIQDTIMNPQLSSASSKSFSRRQQTGHTRHKTKCLKFSCYSSHSLVEQHKVTRTSQNQKTAVPTADSRSKVVSDNVLRNNQRFRPIV